jgi:hypothetical protein
VAGVAAAPEIPIGMSPWVRTVPLLDWAAMI